MQCKSHSRVQGNHDIAHEQKLCTVNTPRSCGNITLTRHDYPADPVPVVVLRFETAEEVVARSAQGPGSNCTRQDLLRSAELPAIAGGPSVTRDLAKVVEGSNRAGAVIAAWNSRGWKTVIADGYHRTCASYHHVRTSRFLSAIIDHPWSRLLGRPGPSRFCCPCWKPCARVATQGAKRLRAQRQVGGEFVASSVGGGGGSGYATSRNRHCRFRCVSSTAAATRA